MSFRPPVIVISGHSDIPTAVTTMKRGALDFMEKPFAASVMADRVREAVLTYRRSVDGPIAGLGDFSGRHLLTSGSVKCWGRLQAGLRTRRRGGGLASARAPSRFTAPASWPS
jgi:DNA-binding response OmpR family regulator